MRLTSTHEKLLSTYNSDPNQFLDVMEDELADNIGYLRIDFGEGFKNHRIFAVGISQKKAEKLVSDICRFTRNLARSLNSKLEERKQILGSRRVILQFDEVRSLVTQIQKSSKQ